MSWECQSNKLWGKLSTNQPIDQPDPNHQQAQPPTEQWTSQSTNHGPNPCGILPIPKQAQGVKMDVMLCLHMCKVYELSAKLALQSSPCGGEK